MFRQSFAVEKLRGFWKALLSQRPQLKEFLGKRIAKIRLRVRMWERDTFLSAQSQVTNWQHFLWVRCYGCHRAVCVSFCVRMCKCLRMPWGGAVMCQKAVCWRQRQPHSPCVRVCVYACVYVCVCMQQFDQSDKGSVVVYTLVLTRCANHILPAYNPLSTSFSPYTHSEPPPRAPQPKTVFICDAQYFLCFSSLKVPLVKALFRQAEVRCFCFN